MNQPAAEGKPGVEERGGKDRRRTPSPALSRYTFVGRRRELRRDEDGTHNYYVDRPRPEAWWAILLLVVLSIADALFSLRLFADGRGHELNPLLLFSLGYGNVVFIVFKLLLTLCGVVVLLIHWHWIVQKSWMNVRFVARGLITLYAIVVIWEIVLLKL